MGGINIYCGSFVGDDKSGTMFETVLAEVTAHARNVDTTRIIRSIISSIDDARDHILISPEDAANLISPFTDCLDHYRNKFSADDLRAYCLIDLLEACKTSAMETEPVAIVW
ncbi:hypothetical protein GA0061102_100311 [Rhizobium miluonense]|uniref:Uncharacterized protein n=1 Tax=Rhizobium miluonense TaxID=411945 RepID=A0A1C3UD66_9HYPH|nr:hypothetical protein GA0061102_100311 [Rhizobium miluonense]